MKKSNFLVAFLFIGMLLSSLTLCAQNPVKWTASAKMTSKSEGVITLTATIDKGWHVYGTNQPEDGPVSTEITMSASKGVTFKGAMSASPKTITMMDDMFGVEVTYWENKVTFTRKFKIKGVKTATATVNVTYMACNDSSCQPPKTETFTVKLK